jgi:hypothetical protein
MGHHDHRLSYRRVMLRYLQVMRAFQTEKGQAWVLPSAVLFINQGLYSKAPLFSFCIFSWVLLVPPSLTV